ncbi:MAG: nonstructural protein [Microvirus sp.]|nr:MAG: nonstructural protein [Microvirus sp.]
MNVYLIAVYDHAIEAYGRPFTVQHPGQAVRSFMDECKNPESDVAKHPGDYELWQLAFMDDKNGDIIQAKERLSRAVDHTQSEK